MRLYLIRHGESTANVTRTYAGQSDVLLTDKGRLQAQSIRSVLSPIRFDKVYTSDLCRASDTQKLALPDAQAEKTELIREYDVGSLVGKPLGYGSIKGVPGRSWDYRDYGGESTQMICDRLRRFLSSLEASPYGCVAAFTHNGIMNSMLQIVLNTSFEGGAVKSDNCAIHVFEFDGSRWKLLAWNYMSV